MSSVDGSRIALKAEQHDAADTATRLKENIYVLMRAGSDSPEEIARIIAERMRQHKLTERLK